jgi:hypothetical protein
MKYLVGTFVDYKTVRQFFPQIHSHVVLLQGDQLTAITSRRYLHNDSDMIPVGVLTDELYFDGDDNLWTNTNGASPTEVKKLIDEMFSVDSKITYITCDY